MINIEEIDKEIENLEHKDYLTYDIVNKLAALYTVKDYFTKKHGSQISMPSTAVK